MLSKYFASHYYCDICTCVIKRAFVNWYIIILKLKEKNVLKNIKFLQLIALCDNYLIIDILLCSTLIWGEFLSLSGAIFPGPTGMSNDFACKIRAVRRFEFKNYEQETRAQINGSSVGLQ